MSVAAIVPAATMRPAASPDMLCLSDTNKKYSGLGRREACVKHVFDCDQVGFYGAANRPLY